MTLPPLFLLLLINLDGFFIRRKDTLWGKELNYGETGKINLLRLARKSSGRWEGKVHETWEIKGDIGVLDNALMHYPHQTIKEFISEINYYSTIRANELKEKQITSTFLSILSYTIGKFTLNYFVKLGFLDGMQGLLFALMMSFHSFLTRSKLWLYYQK